MEAIALLERLKGLDVNQYINLIILHLTIQLVCFNIYQLFAGFIIIFNIFEKSQPDGMPAEIRDKIIDRFLDDNRHDIQKKSGLLKKSQLNLKVELIPYFHFVIFRSI